MADDDDTADRLYNAHKGTAYTDDNFLFSREGRPLRILAEYEDPYSRFRRYDVADTIVFLASREARQITGQTISVNGGQYLY